MNQQNHIRPWRRRLVMGLGGFFALFAGFALWLLGTAWYSVPRYPVLTRPIECSLILTPQGYADFIDTHERPYVYELAAAGNGRVLVFGSEHTIQPDDAQFELIRKRWNDMKPTVALIESDLGMMFPAFMDPVRTFGEVGFVHALARELGIPTYSWEPPDEVLIQAAFDQGFTSEQIALRRILNSYFSNLRHGRPADPEHFVRDTLRERSRIPGSAEVLDTMDKVNAAWQREFPEGPDWRDVSDQYGLPGFLGLMDLNRPRDTHLVACIVDLMNAGERVFVVCGASHAVKIEPALSAIFAE